MEGTGSVPQDEEGQGGDSGKLREDGEKRVSEDSQNCVMRHRNMCSHPQTNIFNINIVYQLLIVQNIIYINKSC